MALATGMSALGLGNDIGGSLRGPASACGVASIRPTQGRVPHAGFIPNEDGLLSVQMMMTNGPMARRVADVRVALSVLAGAHPRDPWSIDTPLDQPRDAVTMRVAIVAQPAGGPTDPTVAKVVRDAGAALRDAGYEVVEIAPPRYEEIAACFGQFSSLETSDRCSISSNRLWAKMERSSSARPGKPPAAARRRSYVQGVYCTLRPRACVVAVHDGISAHLVTSLDAIAFRGRFEFQEDRYYEQDLGDERKRIPFSWRLQTPITHE